MIALTTGQWQKTLSKCCILDEGVDDGMFVVCWITSTCFFMYMRTESLHCGVNFTHTHTCARMHLNWVHEMHGRVDPIKVHVANL